MCVTLREAHRLRVFENRVLRRIFGPKRDKVRGECRKLHNFWAVHFRVGSRLAPGQAWPVYFFLYRSLCEAIVWSLAALGKGERQGRFPELSLWVLIFMLSTRLLGFILSTSGFSGWLGQEQEQFSFQSCYFKLKFGLYLWRSLTSA